MGFRDAVRKANDALVLTNPGAPSGAWVLRRNLGIFEMLLVWTTSNSAGGDEDHKCRHFDAIP